MSQHIAEQMLCFRGWMQMMVVMAMAVRLVFRRQLVSNTLLVGLFCRRGLVDGVVRDVSGDVVVMTAMIIEMRFVNVFTFNV